LVTFGLGQRFEAVDEDLKPFLDTELKKCAPMVKEYVMEKLEKAVIAAMQTFVTKSVDKAFQEKKSEKATPMEFAMEILQDAAHDYARDGFTETVGLLIKEYGSH
jgi:hypothetical protein